MNTPYHNPFGSIAEANKVRELGINVEDLTNIGIFLDSLSTLGTGSTFTEIARTLGRVSEINQRFRGMVKGIHERIQAQLNPVADPIDGQH